MNFTIDEVRALMNKPTNIRNMSVIAVSRFKIVLWVRI